MKTRNGFVSNSSSSSFIVVWGKDPQSENDVHDILFGEDKVIKPYDDSLTSREIAKMVWEDICSQKDKKERKRLLDQAFCGAYTLSKDEVESLIGPKPGYDDDRYWEWHTKAEDLSNYAKAQKLVKEELGPKPEYRKNSKKYDNWYNRMYEILNELDKKDKSMIFKKIKGTVNYIFEYGDSHGDRISDVLEWGGIFDKLTHYRFSHH